jgi:dihydroorotate dehydrogenase (NAD+) catalytic subunit
MNAGLIYNATMDLSLSIPSSNQDLQLSNPVFTASGTFGFGTDHSDPAEMNYLGGIFTKTTTLNPRFGNPQPRIAETSSGMLNSIGLQNPGLEAVISEKAPSWVNIEVPIFVSIAAEDAHEFAYMAERLSTVPGITGIELNLSCPNVAGGLDFSTDPKLAGQVVEEVRKTTQLPIIAKLTPNVTDIIPIAQAVENAGANALSLTNTLVGTAIDVERQKPILSTIFGGLSGPAIKPVALAAVYKVAEFAHVPIIGIGGIRTGADAIEFMLAGATAVQIGTGNFLDPETPRKVIQEIREYMSRHDITKLSDIIGRARG